MNVRLFQNIRQKHSILAVITICLIAVVFNAAAFLFSDVMGDDGHFLHSQISLTFEHLVKFHIIEKTHDPVISIISDSIHDRSPPLI